MYDAELAVVIMWPWLRDRNDQTGPKKEDSLRT